jgi:hypothetical protein
MIEGCTVVYSSLGLSEMHVIVSKVRNAPNHSNGVCNLVHQAMPLRRSDECPGSRDNKSIAGAGLESYLLYSTYAPATDAKPAFCRCRAP